MARTKQPPKVKITWNDILARRAVQEGGSDGLLGAAEVLLEASNMIVPFDTGSLMGTGAVDFDLDAMTASVYYESPYAAKLHQNPGFKFKNGRRGKFLQSAANGAKSRVGALIGEGIKLKFAKGGAPQGVKPMGPP